MTPSTLGVHLMHFRGALLCLALAVCLASCSSSPVHSSGTAAPSGKGTVTGFADSCSGLKENTFVKVVLYDKHRLVASETVRSGTRFRFSVAPGSYLVMVEHRFDSVEVRAGTAVTASLLMVCL